MLLEHCKTRNCIFFLIYMDQHIIWFLRQTGGLDYQAGGRFLSKTPGGCSGHVHINQCLPLRKKWQGIQTAIRHPPVSHPLPHHSLLYLDGKNQAKNYFPRNQTSENIFTGGIELWQADHSNLRLLSNFTIEKRFLWHFSGVMQLFPFPHLPKRPLNPSLDV